jgi:2-keto-3-deoxy-L-rhamnonate aldolase RhmA
VGTRGYGPARASRYGLDGSYFSEANDNMLFLPIIEDERAVRNLDAILATEGVDSFIVGPVDLSISLGVPLQYDHPKFKQAIETVIRVGLASGKPLGTAIYGGDLFSPDTFKRFVDQGFTLLLAGGDEWILQAGCKRLLEGVAALRG